MWFINHLLHIPQTERATLKNGLMLKQRNEWLIIFFEKCHIIFVLLV
jgi:hypothetical protein